MSSNETPRVHLLPGVDVRDKRKPLYRDPHPTQKLSPGRVIATVIAAMVLFGLGYLGNWINTPAPTMIADGFTTAVNGQIDLRDHEGMNGPLLELIERGTMKRLWREPGDKYIRVEFATGCVHKCSSLLRLEDGQPWAGFTRVRCFDRGSLRRDSIAFEARVPRIDLAQVRRIQRGAAGEIVFR